MGLRVTDARGATGIDTATVTVTVTTVLNFNDYTPIQSYGGSGHDIDSTMTILNGGATLSIVGNGWKKIAFPYTVTPNTVIEFDFQSSVQGEIHGIGFDLDNIIGDNSIFQLHGTQIWGGAIQAFNNYAGETPKHYVIPVGTYYTGSMLYLTFAMDDDANTAGESVFSNVQVYEAPVN